MRNGAIVKLRSLYINLSSETAKLTRLPGRVPALAYLFLYLGLIILFSFIYLILPSPSLFHSTSKFEFEHFNKDVGAALQNLRQEIIDVMRENYGQAEVDVDGWILDIDKVNVYSPDFADFPEEFSFKVRVPIQYLSARQIVIDESGPNPPYIRSVVAILSAKVTVPVRPWSIKDNMAYPQISFSEYASSPIEGAPAWPSPEVLFPFKFQRNAASVSDTAIMPISAELYNNIMGVAQGYAGFPSQVSGQYWRMLYLSAGIASSSALGDIVPLTNEARLLVSVETVLAIVLVSLFLNSLAHQIARRR